MDWDDFPVILGQGSVHDLRDNDAPQRSRLWGLKSPSRAACEAAERKAEPKQRKAGFVQGRVTARALAHRP
jgi:hypothetical protein